MSDVNKQPQVEPVSDKATKILDIVRQTLEQEGMDDITTSSILTSIHSDPKFRQHTGLPAFCA